MDEMTPEEIRRFLLDTPRTGHLATVRKDGRPHVAPIWFHLDLRGDDFDVIFTTWHTTVKAANLRRDPRVAMTVDDPNPPYAFVTLEGTIEFIDDLSALRHWSGRIAGRYLGQHLADSYGARNGVPGELLVRMKVNKIVAQKAIAD